MYRFDRCAATYWEATCDKFDAPSIASDIHVDTAIIGAGYLGLSCALHLARDFGHSVAVLEAGHIGWGASGRNGGFNSFSAAKMSVGELIKKFGRDETRKFLQTQFEGCDLVNAIAETEGQSIDRTGDGVINVAHSENAFQELISEGEQVHKLVGAKMRPICKAEFAATVHNSVEQHGGLQQWPGSGIHPLKFNRVLAAACQRHGAELFVRSEVLAHEFSASLHRLFTAAGSVSAKNIVFATNGYHPDGLDLRLNSRVLPAIANILVTRPLTTEELKQHNYVTNSPVVNTRNLLYYYRLLPDNRILFGARGDLSGYDSAAQSMRRRLERSFNQVFPDWRAITTEFFWRGLVALSRKKLPSMGKLEGQGSAWFGFGCHGNGINNQTWMGREIARQIYGSNSPIPLLYRGLPGKLPPSIFLQRLGLRLAYGRYALADKLS